jgi:DNA-binding LacI/PurR family transcriptional regulator
MGPSSSIPNATLQLLRRHIVEGKFAPGSRLPTRRILQGVLGVSPVTLQRALDRLEEEGFVRSVDRVGSFISPQPPHLSRFPLVFVNSPKAPYGPWTRFWQMLATRAPEVAEKSRTKLPVYIGIDGHADNEDYQSLLRDIEMKRLAGLIFPLNPWVLEHTPLVTEPGIPRVAITRSAVGSMHVVVPDYASFFTRAAEYLAQRKRRRIGLLLRERQLAGWNVDLEMLFDRFGLTTRPEWIQVVSSLDSARSVTHLLMSPRNADRPDGLILGDDNWMDHATAGLIAAGVRVPEDADVVTHCNFPQPEPRVMPFKRLGWDVRHLLNSCLEVLADIREGKNPPIERLEPTLFDHELEVE